VVSGEFFGSTGIILAHKKPGSPPIVEGEPATPGFTLSLCCEGQYRPYLKKSAYFVKSASIRDSDHKKAAPAIAHAAFYFNY
jgi:hypothetical protein